MITKMERDSIMARENALHQWMKDTGRVTKHGSSYHPKDLPEHIQPPTNEERAEVEIFDFMTDKPAEYVAYMDLADNITTWTGDMLGVTKGQYLHAINGRIYKIKPSRSKDSDLVKLTALLDL